MKKLDLLDEYICEIEKYEEEDLKSDVREAFLAGRIVILEFLLDVYFGEKKEFFKKRGKTMKQKKLKKELIDQCKETAELNLEICDEFRHTEPKIKKD